MVRIHPGVPFSLVKAAFLVFPKMPFFYCGQIMGKLKCPMVTRKKRPFTVSVKRDGNRWRVSCTINGKLYRPRFDKKKEAIEEKKRLLEVHGNVGREGTTLLAGHDEDASRALKLLKPHDALLSDAAQFYIERYLKFKADKTFNTHFNDLLEKLDWKKRRDKTKASLIDRTSAFLKDFGETYPRDLAPGEFVDWFLETSKSKNWVEWTMSGTKRKLSQLFLHVIKQKGMDTNPCDLLELPDIPEKVPEIYNLQEVAALLHHSITYDLQNYFAIGFFAGLRPEKEAFRLEMKHFHFDTNQIFVPPEWGKTRSRSVDIHPTLLSWLSEYLPEEGRATSPTNFRKRKDYVFRDAGVTKKHDAIRHTFASMAYIETGKKQYVIEQMGHKGDDSVFDNHYKRLVKRNTAENFFEFTPRMIELLMTADMKDMFWKDLLGDGDKKGWRIKEANLDNFELSDDL